MPHTTDPTDPKTLRAIATEVLANPNSAPELVRAAHYLLEIATRPFDERAPSRPPSLRLG